jgi:2-phospho-L-lactate guanylyltransferase
METVVVPFRAAGKSRLDELGAEGQRRLALGMLGDVVAACTVYGETAVVTGDDEAAALAEELGARPLGDPGGGQGEAVAAALDEVGATGALVVNADVPCVVPHDLRTLAAAVPEGGLALVPAADGTTNALALSARELFAPLYGPGSANRFRERAAALGREAMPVAIPNLADDVDTLDDLRRLQLRVGPRTLAALPPPPALVGQP